MIGKAYTSVFPFYDARNRRMAHKIRPVLIIGKADDYDYIVLPISRITRQENIDIYYDIPITPSDVPLMNLTQRSYIRTHKQATVHAGELHCEITNFKEKYLDIYLTVLSRVEEFQNEMIDNAL